MVKYFNKLSRIMENCDTLKIDVYYKKLYYEFDMAPHIHDKIEILAIEQGVCNMDIYLGNDIKTVKIRERDVLIIDAGIKHRMHIKSPSGCLTYNLELSRCELNEADIDFSFKKLAIKSECFVNFVQSFSVYKCTRDCKNVIETIKQIIDNLVVIQSLEINYILNLLIHKTFLEISIENKTASNLSGTKYIKNALNYIHTHFEENIKIKDIASCAFIHQSYLEELFKEQIGTTIIEYINIIRINKAKSILKNSDIPIVDICVAVGFNSRQHFARTFKSLVGVSPTEFRKNDKNTYVQSWIGMGTAKEEYKEVT